MGLKFLFMVVLNNYVLNFPSPITWLLPGRAQFLLFEKEKEKISSYWITMIICEKLSPSPPLLHFPR